MRSLLVVWICLLAGVAQATSTASIPGGGNASAAAVSTLTDDAGCLANTFVRRNAGDTSFECAAVPGSGDALTSATLAQFAATSSGQFAGIISDETGTGEVVLAHSATLIDALLSTPILSEAVFTSGALGDYLRLGGGGDFADAGQLRMENASTVCWEASPAGTDVCIAANSSEQLVLTGGAFSGTATGLTGTAASLTAGAATALAANGGNCSAGSFPLGVDTSGAAESCTDVVTQAESAARVESECFTLYAPTAGVLLTDDVTSVWRAPVAVTITEVWCETNTGTVNMDVQIDNGTPTDVMGVDLACISTGATDSTSLTGSMAAGNTLDFAITTVATSPTRLTVCIKYTR